MPKNHCHSMPKKRRSWCLPIEPWAPNPKLELQNVNRVLQICTVSSNSQACAPMINSELQFSTLTSNYQPWAPILNPVLQRTYSQIHKNLQIELNCPKRVATMSKYTCHLLLYIIIYYMFFYFYYILFYIICILFLLYVILYYINCHNSIRIFLLYPNLNKEPSH